MRPDPDHIRGVLLDMDGTLVDHIETITRCFQHATRELGFPEPSSELVKRSIGGSMPVTIQKFLPPEKVEEGKALWQACFEALHLEGVIVLPGARELLERCRETGRKAGVFTNKTGRHTRAIMENEGLAPLLDFSLGAEDTPYRKPQLEFSRAAIERLDLPAASVAMIGDSPFDVQAAQTVGMVALCVTTGAHSRTELQEAGADIVFGSLREIADWFASACSEART